MVGGPKCPSEMKGLKPNPGSQTKTKRASSRCPKRWQKGTLLEKSGRGWANKARVQGSSPPTNDSMTPSQTKFGRGLSKKPKAQVGWSLSLSTAVLCKKKLDDQDIGPQLRWKESGQRPFGPEVCTSSPAIRDYWNCWELLQLQDGILMHCFFWDMMQQVIICSSLYLGHCIMKFCTTFTIPY